MNTTQYIPDNGIRVFGDSETQILTSNTNGTTFDLVSEVMTDYSPFLLNNKNSVDSCWESGNIYIADSLSSEVKKISFDGTLLYSLSLTTPKSVSVIQREAHMLIEPVEDRGCWIIDGNNAVQTDNELSVTATVAGFNNPTFIVSSRIDKGCYVIDASKMWRLDEDGTVLASQTLPSSIIEVKTNAYGELYILSPTRLYRYGYNSTTTSIVLLSNLSISAYFAGKIVASMDIDLSMDMESAQNVYIAGGDAHNYRVMRWNRILSLSTSGFYAGEYPYVLRVVQHSTSKVMFVLEDNEQYYLLDNSSSSSSSSTEVRSSSSSSTWLMSTSGP